MLKWGILGLICLFAFAIRLFAVVRYESVIHEFDPNTRTWLAVDGRFAGTYVVEHHVDVRRGGVDSEARRFLLGDGSETQQQRQGENF